MVPTPTKLCEVSFREGQDEIHQTLKHFGWIIQIYREKKYQILSEMYTKKV